MIFKRNFKQVELSQEEQFNVLVIDGQEYFLQYIDSAGVRQGGGNSSVFRAMHPDGDDSYVVKFCRYPLDSRSDRDKRRIQRFEREIQALQRALASAESKCVIPIVEVGKISIKSDRGGQTPLIYYVMKNADSDLATFLAENELQVGQKVALCNSLLRILKGLHAIGIYHRDIKPQNILMMEGAPIFGDLGLVDFREEDGSLDEFDEKIGPIGYLSPEATNKCLGLRSKESFTFDCAIDAKSDVFQLGQVFWLVVQDEVPTGHLIAEDLKYGAGDLLENVIRPMLQYGKQRRATVLDVENALQPVLRDMAVI